MARGKPTRQLASGRIWQRVEQLLAKGEQVVDDRLAAGGGGLAELVGALVAPIALLPLDDELLHVAQVRAGLADEVARGELELVQVVAAEAAGGAGGLDATGARSAPCRSRPSRRCTAAP